MKCDAANGYAGWKVVDLATGGLVDHVVWVDPETKSYCTVDQPFRIVAGEVAKTVHVANDITEDFTSMTFWMARRAVLVAPLSAGRQQQEESTGKPCADCCQPEACRRIDYCAAHRGPFGERAP
jgi:hypothetical protein